MSLQYLGGLGDVIVHTAGTACDDALIDHHLPVYHLAAQVKLQIAEAGPFLRLSEDISCVFLQLMDRICLRRVEGQCRHRLNLIKVYGHHSVVIGAFSRLQLPVITGAATYGQIFLHLFIGFPYRGEAGSLGGHHINTNAIVYGQVGNTGTGELQYLVLHKIVFIGGSAQGDRHIMRADSLTWAAGEVHEHHLRAGQIIGTA